MISVSTFSTGTLESCLGDARLMHGQRLCTSCAAPVWVGLISAKLPTRLVIRRSTGQACASGGRSSMADFDLVVRGGTVVTAADTFRADVGVRDGRIVALGEKLEGAQVLDADGLLVMPGGVDTHCHIEQLRPNGGADQESFVTGSTACLAGGTTTVITFAAQFKGHGILDTLAEYHRRAKQA